MNWLDANFLPWLVPVPPLLAFFTIVLLTHRNKLLTYVIAVGCMAISWVMGWALVFHAIQFKTLGMNTAGGGVFGSAIPWLANGNNSVPLSGALNMGVMVDPLTTVMMFMVPFVCLAIFVYAIGYMAHDPRPTRFFAFLSLFAGAMLILVVADNLLLLFIGWEIMGLCSYLLIGFWYEKPSAYKAAIKAFMTTRVGDVIMMIGIGYLWAATGTLSFRGILYNEELLKRLADPAFGGILGVSAATLIGICIVCGTIGKSAQFPLHVWLPDAMEGPTPVSAMIHAAAMVSAGVYLVIRMFPLLSAGGNPEEGILTAPMTLMAVIGAFTALFAATIAISQNDIKKVLAYSTISQLGFMIAALGIGAYTAAAFHLITHAFFKALLFLGSGSVIHGMEHGHHASHGAHGESHDAHTPAAAHAAAHDEHGAHEEHGHATPTAPAEPEFDAQDMRNMGGLWRRMPVTAATFIIGGASLAGFPLITAGFWSKDEIFADAWAHLSTTPLAWFVLICLALAATLTALYTLRQIAMTFFGSPRTKAAMHAGHNDGTAEGRNISVLMTAPLVVLAFFAIFAGFAGVNPDFWIIGPILSGLFKISAPFGAFVGRTILEPPAPLPFSIWPVLISFTVFGVGTYFGYRLYFERKVAAGAPDPVEGIVGADVYRILQNKYYIDEFYGRVFVNPARWVAETLTLQIIDKGIIDAALHAIGRGATWTGELFRQFNRVVIDGVGDGIPQALAEAARSLRNIQTGHIQQYLLYALIGAIVVGINFAVIVFFKDAVPVVALIEGILAVVVIVIGPGGALTSKQ